MSDESSYLGIFFLATAGQNGPNLGIDEEEIVLMVLSILHISTNEVMVTSSFVIQPRTSDINENILSEECKVDFKITDEWVKNAKPIENAIEQLDEIIRTHTAGGKKFSLVVDGQLPLRQCLHPEASAKEITLPEYYYEFYDLRKEFEIKYGHKPEDIEDMISHLGICNKVNTEDIVKTDTETEKSEATGSPAGEESESVINLEVAGEQPDEQKVKMDVEVEIKEEAGDAMGKIHEMGLIVKKMITDNHNFANLELINQKLEPGICLKSEEVDNNCVVRARGLPWQSSDADIAKFFRGLNIAKGGVALCLSPQGRRNGEALIRFQDQEHRDMALKRHKHHIATRYIEVYRATGDDFINIAGGSNNEAQAFLSRGGNVIVRMRGLPYDCTPKQVIEFFEAGDNGCSVLEGEEGVLFVKRPDGRATGDAFVLFSAEDDAGKALSKHRESIGSRYIELFRSTTAEVQQVLNRCLEPKSADLSPQLPLIPPVTPVAPVNQVPSLPILPQHIITSGTRKDCIRLRGLPYEAQVEHILEFLGEFAKNIVYQGVHMVYNAQGQPSGEAFIQMDSEQSAYLAAQSKHHRYMMYFKKQRYIEVFQCSGDDMNMVLTGGLPPQKALVSPGVMTTPYAYPYAQAPQLIPSLTPRNGPGSPYYPQIFYWPYPSVSPPVSPNYYGALPGATPALISQDFAALTLNGNGHPKALANGHSMYPQPPPVMTNGHGHGDLGKILNGAGGVDHHIHQINGFRNDLVSISEKQRPPLIPTKNYELGLFMA